MTEQDDSEDSDDVSYENDNYNEEEEQDLEDDIIVDGTNDDVYHHDTMNDSNENDDEDDMSAWNYENEDQNTMSKDDIDEKSNEDNEIQDMDIFALETPSTTAKINEQYKKSNGQTLTVTTSSIIKFKGTLFAVIFVDDLAPCWYYLADQFTGTLKALYTANKLAIPAIVSNMKEHKLRVKYSSSNEKKIRDGATYPETRWCTVVPLNPVNPENHLANQLKLFTRLFKKALEPKPHITPGRRFMTFIENSGMDRVLRGCGYMGDLAAIEKQTNAEFIKLGKKEHMYIKNESLDAFWSDLSIKQFLEEFLGCSSWDDVPEGVKKVCFKHYPNRRNLPNWDTMIN